MLSRGATLLLAIYPLLVPPALKHLSPAVISLLIVALLLLRLVSARAATPLPMIRAALAAAGGILLLSFLDPELGMRLYPVLMTATMLAVFTHSLLHPPSMIERFARIVEPELSPDGIRYTRKVTMVWCVFLALNLLISCYTVYFTSIETWSLYNGLISYLLMGLLFAGEFLVRRLSRP
ncbi:MAG: hypothetical protein CSB44_01820 [Gammaproteobacteria bacterium]|nr:MAG: hypothetical protein CSB44_01820 [Gammaproteobacteria bacterium]